MRVHGMYDGTCVFKALKGLHKSARGKRHGVSRDAQPRVYGMGMDCWPTGSAQPPSWLCGDLAGHDRSNRFYPGLRPSLRSVLTLGWLC